MTARAGSEPRIWDVTQPLRPGIPVWPGDAPFEAVRTVTLGEGVPFNLTRLTMSAHTGTHADGRLHYLADGEPVGAADVRAYLGPAQLLTVEAVGGIVPVDAVLGRLRPGVRRLLLRTYERFPLAAWRSDFAGVAPALVDHIAGEGCILIGTDAPSLDPEASKTMSAHAAVARHGLAILEGLVFDGVDDGVYELVALPLRLTTADASPVRALLRELPAGEAR